MTTDYQIPELFLFNPLKHHLGFIREFIHLKSEAESNNESEDLIKELKHIGTSVTDVYRGSISIFNIFKEVEEFLEQNGLLQREPFSLWAGIYRNNFRIITLSDGSRWTMKYHNNKLRYVHLFPARNSKNTFRVKSNTLKSALLYNILSGKDYISGNDINRIRMLLGLSPIKDTADIEAITEMIEILRG